MSERFTSSMEDYLKAIYSISAEYGRATTSQIAEELGFRPGSVTRMLKKLGSTDPLLLEYKKHKGVRLTAEGEKKALEIIRNHRLLEVYLYERMDYSLDKIHPEADRLEHVISKDFLERITGVLNDPVRDPHGDPIPTRDLKMPQKSKHKLCDLREGQNAKIVRIGKSSPDFLSYLEEIGLLPGVSISITKYSPYDGNLEVEIGSQAKPITLGPRITESIYVNQEEKELFR